MGTKVTLKQIAEEAGVSLTTVHRVLNGKEGCSEEVRKRILRIAKEHEYSVNLTASSLRRSTLNIALIFPENEERSRYFLQQMLNGYLKARSELENYNVVFQEFYVSVDQSGKFSAATYLKRIYRAQPVRFDGVILYNIGMDVEQLTWANRLIGSGIPIICMERAPEGDEDIPCVAVDDALAADLASELMSKFVHNSGTVLLLNQSLRNGDQNGRIFRECLNSRRDDLEICAMDFDLLTDQTDAIAELINETPDLTGIYATCARHTVSMLKALEHHPGNYTVIGSELFDESYEALQNGTLDAVIDKRPEKIGYLALRLMMEHLAKNVPLQAVYRVTPRIVLRANSNMYYKHKEESHYESDG